jgi:cyclohexanecarboxylate-CoA ligase
MSLHETTARVSTRQEGLGPYTADDIDRYYAEGSWQDAVLYDLAFAGAQAHPDRNFVSDGEVSYSYGELRTDAVLLAAALAGLGVGRGDRVAAQMPNWSEFAVIAVALSRLGAVLVPIMPIFRHEEVGYVLRHSGARILIGPAHFHRFDHLAMYGELSERLPGLEHILVVRPEPSDALTGARDLAAVIDEVRAAHPSQSDVHALDSTLGPAAGPDDGSVVIYTSGTTSRPKGCYHSFNTFHATSKGMIDTLGVTENDVFFNPSPVSHTTGLVTGLIVPMLAGGSTHFMPAWDPADGLARIRDNGCTITVTSTTFLSTVMEAYDPRVDDLSSMKRWICAGAPIPGSLVQAARSTFPGCAILSLYGRSENLITSMCGPSDPPERSVLSDGGALPGAEIRIVDEAGRELSHGESGDIAYRGPSHMLGYFRDAEQTRALFTPDGFSRSGDLGVMDAAGSVRVNGRLKDIIIRGGINISSREVEDLLITHPAIRDAAVVSMPDARLGERACAFIVCEPGHEGPTLEQVSEFLRGKKIAVQKHPERIEVIAELPLTPVGKVSKAILRDRIREILAEDASRDASGEVDDHLAERRAGLDHGEGIGATFDRMP